MILQIKLERRFTTFERIKAFISETMISLCLKSEFKVLVSNLWMHHFVIILLQQSRVYFLYFRLNILFTLLTVNLALEYLPAFSQNNLTLTLGNIITIKRNLVQLLIIFIAVLFKLILFFFSFLWEPLIVILIYSNSKCSLFILYLILFLLKRLFRIIDSIQYMF